MYATLNANQQIDQMESESSMIKHISLLPIIILLVLVDEASAVGSA
jgi:hypothetical protein